ncbi:iron-containing redox enzyme family protein [Candidatus Nitronereus thalassa]|uniref:Iron-containing redox enzyme family protein n=1 Tax=Candidatus Nitronereus thalassa TaxID=3020898 RepID=A0ABU3KBY0_9BACT|nr:iron-containing redox enzyme family protein [Candidatus Nitronereus thalassa]MDT7043954.1 iron-containing redox enzyme family protein [Candidatus Nitronereus thalassa]
MIWKLSADQFRERLFDIVSRKQHWSTPYFNGSTATKAQLNIHFRQEYAVYIRDFSVLLGRLLGKNPAWEMRRQLATTIYEEETGKLSLGQPHQELFLDMMLGLGYPRAEFRDVELLSQSFSFREWLDDICQEQEWIVGAAILTLLVEGSANDRQEVFSQEEPKSEAEIEDIVLKHPLVIYHGLDPKHMDLVRVREMIEPSNRKIVYDSIVKEATANKQHTLVLEHLEEGLQLWLNYRDGIARACGLRQV